MTSEQIETILDFYMSALTDLGFKSKNLGNDPLGSLEAFKHVLWMCQEAKKLVRTGEMEKVGRWLGFIQGVFWTRGLYTINEMREHNRG